MTDLTKLTLAAARKGLADKSFSSTELTGAYLSAIEAANPKLNAYVAVTADQARNMAAAADTRLYPLGAPCALYIFYPPERPRGQF